MCVCVFEEEEEKRKTEKKREQKKGGGGSVSAALVRTRRFGHSNVFAQTLF